MLVWIQTYGPKIESKVMVNVSVKRRYTPLTCTRAIPNCNIDVSCFMEKHFFQSYLRTGVAIHINHERSTLNNYKSHCIFSRQGASRNL
jgi:hypothetical protein